MALTVDTPRNARPRGKQAYQAKNAEVFFFGSMVGMLLSTGRVQKWGDTAGLVWKGLCLKGVTGNTGASPVTECQVDESGPIIERVAVTGLAGTVADTDKNVYATDDGTFTLTPTANVGPVARVKRFLTSAICDLEILTPEESLAMGGISIWSAPVTNAKIADGTILTFTPGFRGRILSVNYLTDSPVTTAAKLSTITPKINGVALTGGVISLTSATMTPIGTVVAGTAVTGANAFGPTDPITLVASATTAFVEGTGSWQIVLKSDPQ